MLTEWSLIIAGLFALWDRGVRICIHPLKDRVSGRNENRNDASGEIKIHHTDSSCGGCG